MAVLPPTFGGGYRLTIRSSLACLSSSVQSLGSFDLKSRQNLINPNDLSSIASRSVHPSFPKDWFSNSLKIIEKILVED